MDISEAIWDARDYYRRNRGLSPAEINMGTCAAFARKVKRKTDADVRLVGDGRVTASGVPVNGLDSSFVQRSGHVWIYDGRLHYDAEIPEGTPDFHTLPIFAR